MNTQQTACPSVQVVTSSPSAIDGYEKGAKIEKAKALHRLTSGEALPANRDDRLLFILDLMVALGERTPQSPTDPWTWALVVNERKIIRMAEELGIDSTPGMREIALLSTDEERPTDDELRFFLERVFHKLNVLPASPPFAPPVKGSPIPVGVALVPKNPSVEELAKAYNLDVERLRKALERERRKNPDIAIELEPGDRRPHHPYILYYPDRVQHVIAKQVALHNVRRAST